MVPSAYTAHGTFGGPVIRDLGCTRESRTYGPPAKHIPARFTIGSSRTKLDAHVAR